jgi:hypothetical protein
MLAAARGVVAAAARTSGRGLTTAATARAAGATASNFMPLAEHDPELHAIIAKVRRLCPSPPSKKHTHLPMWRTLHFSGMCRWQHMRCGRSPPLHVQLLFVAGLHAACELVVLGHGEEAQQHLCTSASDDSLRAAEQQQLRDTSHNTTRHFSRGACWLRASAPHHKPRSPAHARKALTTHSSCQPPRHSTPQRPPTPLTRCTQFRASQPPHHVHTHLLTHACRTAAHSLFVALTGKRETEKRTGAHCVGKLHIQGCHGGHGFVPHKQGWLLLVRRMTCS